ncbi:MAG TPA: hypothetical protein VKR32_16195, partial [Puia sp.]|nr:hypothetical protein [Puia sp.]
TSDTIPSNISDIRSGTGITLNPFPNFLPVTQLIPNLALGYYYIDLGNSDTLTIILQADSNSGGNASVVGTTSESGPNYYLSGDSLQFLQKLVTYVGSLGDTEQTYYTRNFTKGYVLSGTDTLNFSDPNSVTQVYFSGLPTNNGYNLYNISGYIAFRIKNSTGYRYGWFEASSSPSSGQLLNIYEIAFDKNYDELLTLGEYK